MVSDPIADMLTRIKNALRAQKPRVELPYSKMKFEIAKLLKEKGYLDAVERRGKKNPKILELSLVYDARGEGRLEDLKRVSKPSRRVYKKAFEIKKVKGGLGLQIISTSQGLKTDAECRRLKLGGEVICEVW